MSKIISGIAAVALLMVLGGMAAGEEVQNDSAEISTPVQVIEPQLEILDRPLILEVQVDPNLGVDTSMRILCAVSSYRGQVQFERQDTRVRLAISGDIKELTPDKILVLFDIEAQTDDMNGGKSFAGRGAAILEPGKPKTVLTAGGNSVMLTVRLAE
jgi:hypothetical protein